jgi:hypothetical protein
MTDAEIIKALEICGDQTMEDGHCRNCPCQDACYGEEGIHALEKAALDLIKRQQERIERQKDNLDAVLKERATLDVDKIVEQLKEKSYGFKDLEYIDLDTAVDIVKGVQNE